ncbi:MAG TPA: hypothetical protein VGW40_02545 [Allosphingosinicella sp.]|nr:hypothetical protein [Allosphingosinicella sp.]
MRKLMIASLLAGQVLALQPAAAADFAEARQQQAGAFAGFRMRLPLDGARRERHVRAGLTVAPTMHSRTAAGESQWRIGEGFELGIAGRAPVRLTLGGTPINRLAQGPSGPDGRRAGVSTLGWIGIGIGAAVVIVVGAAALCASDHDCIPSE